MFKNPPEVSRPVLPSALDILIRKISLDPIGLHGQDAIENYIRKFQVATMSLEVA